MSPASAHRVLRLLERVGDRALRGVEVVRQQAADEVAVAVVANDEVGLAAAQLSRTHEVVSAMCTKYLSDSCTDYMTVRLRPGETPESPGERLNG